MATQRDRQAEAERQRQPGTQTERGGEAKKDGGGVVHHQRTTNKIGNMENAQVKVNGDTDQTSPTGLQDITDEQLAAELESRGFEVWKWPREKDWKQ